MTGEGNPGKTETLSSPLPLTGDYLELIVERLDMLADDFAAVIGRPLSAAEKAAIKAKAIRRLADIPPIHPAGGKNIDKGSD